jgi:hypothetical protein
LSPTVFRQGPYRFSSFSREEERVHVHVLSPDGEAKFCLEPTVALAQFDGLNQRQLKQLHQIVEEHKGEIRKAWKDHFGR